MRWTPGDTSQDIEDRRDDSGGGGAGFGGFGAAHLGVGGTLALIVLSLIFHQNFFALFSGGGPGPATSTSEPRPPSADGRPVSDASRSQGEEHNFQLVNFVLKDVQATWERLLPQQANRPYHHAKLVLFRDSIQSGCGGAEAATGPFYCPEDEKVYIDLGFYDELKSRFGASGEFAQAYVLAHEIGHHVQKLLGIEQKVHRAQEQDRREAKPLSVRLELQADCFAGVWANSTQQRNIIDQSDVKSGLDAAAAVGDDHLQKMMTGHVNPDSFTHGSSAQRTSWFRRGLESGQISACDTFGGQ